MGSRRSGPRRGLVAEQPRRAQRTHRGAGLDAIAALRRSPEETLGVRVEAANQVAITDK